MLLRAACRRYERSALHLAPSTLAARRSLHRQLCARLGELDLAAINERQLDRYARARLSSGLHVVSVNNELRALETLRRWAERRGLAIGAAPRRLVERPSFRVRSWTRDEVARLLAATARVSPAIASLVELIASTGLRRGEALALRWENVDLPRRLLRIWPCDEWKPKSGKPREVPIGDDLAVLLARLPRRSRYVFPSRSGTRYRYWPQLQFDRAAAAAGLDGGPHTLRHTYATEFLAAGGSLPMLAQILGHSDERTTRLYAHLRPDHLAAARNLVRWDHTFAPVSREGRTYSVRPVVQRGTCSEKLSSGNVLRGLLRAAQQVLDGVLGR